MYKFSERSLENLKGVDERLIEIMTLALSRSKNDFGITEGIRTIKRQQELVKNGKSKTMNSYHLKGKAVDVAIYKNGKISWEIGLYKELNDIIQRIAKEKGYKITWGGDWRTFADGPHFQIEG